MTLHGEGRVFERRQWSKLKLEVEFRHQRAHFEFLYGGHISGPDQNISTKLGRYVENGLAKEEWSKYDSFENPIWRAATMYNTYNIPAVTSNVN